MVARLLLWSIPGSDVDELLGRLPALEPPSAWLRNEATDRFGAFVVTEEGEDAPEPLADARALIGREPDVYEEFDLV